MWNKFSTQEYNTAVVRLVNIMGIPQIPVKVLDVNNASTNSGLNMLQY